MADAQTGISIPYKGTRSIESLLKLVLERRGGEPIIENSNLMGIKREDGSRITLENGGAVEYASPPVADIASVMEFAQNELRLLAEDAARLGIALVSGANYPLDAKSPWALMRQYFASAGEVSTSGPEVVIDGAKASCRARSPTCSTILRSSTVSSTSSASSRPPPGRGSRDSGQADRYADNLQVSVDAQRRQHHDPARLHMPSLANRPHRSADP